MYFNTVAERRGNGGEFVSISLYFMEFSFLFV